MGLCVCSMFCCAVLCVLSSFTIILMGTRELVAFLCLSSWCLSVAVIVLSLFLTVLWVGLQCVIVKFPDHTHTCFLGSFLMNHMPADSTSSLVS